MIILFIIWIFGYYSRIQKKIDANSKLGINTKSDLNNVLKEGST